jgi:transcriptional regulator with XRE-family HTH domain
MAKPQKLDRRRQLGLQIKFARGERSWRLRDLAVKTGLSAPKLCRIEGGLERIRLDELELIAKALKLQVTDLTDPEVEFSSAPPRKGGPNTKPARKAPTRKPGKTKAPKPAKVAKPVAKPKRKVKARRPRAPRMGLPNAPGDLAAQLAKDKITADDPHPRDCGCQACMRERAESREKVPAAGVYAQPKTDQLLEDIGDLVADMVTQRDSSEPDQQDLPRVEAPAADSDAPNAPVAVDADDSVKSAAS